MIQDGDYGVVVVNAGQHKGKVGYYDDDDMKSAIVYFDDVLEGEYFIIQRRYLDPAPLGVRCPALDKFVEENPLVAHCMGVDNTPRR